jgi:hypothetical protein
MIDKAFRSAARISRILSSVSAGRLKNQEPLFALFRSVRIRLRWASSSARLCAVDSSATFEPGVYSRARFFPFIVDEGGFGRNRLGRVLFCAGAEVDGEDALLCGEVCATVVIALAEEHILHWRL